MDQDGLFTKINETELRWLGFTREEIVGKMRFTDILTQASKQVFFENFYKLKEVGWVQDLEFELIKKNGAILPVLLNAMAVNDVPGGGFLSRATVFDITERKRSVEKLRELSLIDDLTGLNNRRAFFTLATQQIKVADRLKQGLALVYSDMDNLKWINDNLGHGEGDQALRDMANLLKNSFRVSDIIARLGGDEFVGLALETVEKTNESIMTRLAENLNALNLQSNRPYKMAISFGLARYDPENPCTIAELIERGDRLMYEQKQEKKRR